MNTPVTVLGIETSCDETAAGIVTLGPDGVAVRADIVRAQLSEHAPYGGVVPEIAARAHAEAADQVVAAALAEAGLDLGDLSGIAATAGPGLIGGLLVGLMTGKALAMASARPFLAINHLEGHALSPRLGADCPFPYLLLLVSGGHCQFIDVAGLGTYRRLGTTIDDAVGEAFDKTAKVLGLGFPGGPAVERTARAGNPAAIALPRPMLTRPDLDMSFAGLKTAVARAAEAGPLTEARKADLCAGFQAAICDVLTEKARRALSDTGHRRLVVAGGVASNTALRARLAGMAEAAGAELILPALRHCTDNGAMIALAGAERLAAGWSDPESLAAPARARWPLDGARAAAEPAYGHGKRGVKV